MDYVQVVSPSWCIMLNMKKVELQLIPDLDMYIFFENSTYNKYNILVNTVKSTISICSLMNQKKNQNLLYT